MQHLVAASVPEPHAVEAHVPCDRRQLARAISVVDLGLLVEHAHDLVQRGRGREERVVELRELLDRVEEVLHVEHEGEQRPERHLSLEVEVPAEAEQSELEDLVNALAPLRADELVAEKPADLKPYGLDKPEVRWRFLLGDKEVLSVLVGGFEKTKHGEGPRCYAKLAAGDVVFLLEPTLTKKVLSEYRHRSIWTSLDSAQVERIRFGYAQNPFVLEKIDNSWHVTGKLAVPIKAEKVSETLDVLSRLKVERFVVDNNADLKLYGLEPPQLILEIQTPSDKKTLHIGRAEGTTKKYYARVPEPNRSDVFILSETDAAKIFRTAADFGK